MRNLKPQENVHRKKEDCAILGVFVIALALAAVIAAVIAANLPSFYTDEGARGESIVASRLQSLPQNEYTMLNDVMLPTKDGTTTQIDHIVVSRFGIFVIETKNYNGWIFSDEKQRQWTQTFRGGWWGCKKFHFQNPIRQNWRHIYVLSEVLGLPLRCFHNIVVFCGDAEFKTLMPQNVVYTHELARYIQRFATPLMNAEKVGRIATTLTRINTSLPMEKRTAHVRNLRTRHDPVLLAVAAKAGTLKCPKCGSSMVLRHRHSDGGAFYGCSRYPNCHCTMSAG